MLAAQSGHKDVFYRLYRHSNKGHIGKDKKGWGILHFAAKGGNIRILKTTLQRGVLVLPPSAAGTDGALVRRREWTHPRRQLSHSPRKHLPGARDAKDRTALVAAAVKGHLDVVMTLASGRFWMSRLVDSPHVQQ